MSTIDVNNPHVGDFEFSDAEYFVPVRVKRVKRRVIRVYTDPVSKEKIGETVDCKAKEQRWLSLAQFKELLK